jgi:hypothetical protein
MPVVVRIPGSVVLLGAQPVVYLGVAVWIASQAESDRWNALLSYRPRLLGAYLSSVDPWSYLLSSSVKYNGDVPSVDNSYLQLLIGGGAVMFILFCVAFAIAIRALIRRRMAHEIAFISTTLIYGISESVLLRVENIFVLFTWVLILYYVRPERGQTAFDIPSEPPSTRRASLRPASGLGRGPVARGHAGVGIARPGHRGR